MRPLGCVLLTLPALAGCLAPRVCGRGEYLISGDDVDMERLDPDGDGYGEAYFRCGVLWDVFGLREGGQTTFTLAPSLDPYKDDSFDVETSYGPAGQLTAPDEALDVGATLTPTGTGSHIIYLNERFTRATYGLGEGTVEVLDRRDGGGSVAEQAGNAVEWRLRWEAEFVDPQDEDTVLQRIEGEDWVPVSDG